MAGGAWCHHVEKPEWHGQFPVYPLHQCKSQSHIITPSLAHSCVLQKIDGFSKSDTKDAVPSIHQAHHPPIYPRHRE